MKLNELKAEVMSVKTLKELKEVDEVLSYRWKQIQQENCGDFSKGDKVEFESKGRTYEGTVIRVNTKSLSVMTAQGKWRISPSLATKSEVGG